MKKLITRIVMSCFNKLETEKLRDLMTYKAFIISEILLLLY